MNDYIPLLDRKTKSPYSRLLSIENELNEHTLEITTTYTLLLCSRQREIIHHNIVCRTLSIMMGCP